MPLFKVLTILIPLATRIVKATRKDSPGGKKITKEELLEIVLGELDGVHDRLG